MPEHQMAPPQSYPSGIPTLGPEQLRAGQVGLWETLLVPLQKGPCWFPYKRVLGDPAGFPIGEFWGILLVSLQKQSSEGVGLISLLKKGGRESQFSRTAKTWSNTAPLDQETHCPCSCSNVPKGWVISWDGIWLHKVLPLSSGSKPP